MSLSSILASPSADELRKNIDARQFQLSTLDYSMPNFNVVKERLKADVKTMEAQLKQLEAPHQQNNAQDPVSDFYTTLGARPPHTVPVREQQQKRPYTSQSSPLRHTGFEGYAQSQQNGFGGHFASDGPVMGQVSLNGGALWSFSPLNSTPSTPAMGSRLAPASASTTDSSPEQTSINSTPPLPTLAGFGRKRPRDSLNLPPILGSHGAKSMRTTPSPAQTGAATPASDDSFDAPDDSDFFRRLIGGDVEEDLRDMRQQQREIEEETRERQRRRQEQERIDQEIAQSLQAEYQQELIGRPSSASSAGTFGGPLGISHASSRTILDNSGRYRLPEPPLLSSGSAGPSNSMYPPYVQPGSTTSSFNNPYVIKSEQTNPMGSRPALNSSNFIDLGSDSEEENFGPDFGSDLIEIDPASFRPNARKSKTGMAPAYSENFAMAGTFNGGGTWADIDNVPTADLSYATTPSQHLTPYGSMNNYNPDLAMQVPGPANTWTSTFDRVRQDAASAAKGLASTISSTVNSTYNNIINTQGAYQNGANLYGGNAYGGYDGAGSAGNSHLLGYSPTKSKSGLTRQNNYNMAESIDLYPSRLHDVTSLWGDPNRGGADIKKLLENIRPDEELDAGPRSRIGTPEDMTEAATLYEHQKLGLKWMIDMEAGSNKGGILADDMGLGKTVQAIALMVKNRPDDDSRKTTLIVAPVALLRQWESEISLKVKPEKRLSTYIYHASKGKNITWQALRRYDVVLTTYGTLAAEYNRKDIIDIARRANPNWRPVSTADRLPLLGDECKWYRVILDEAQNIKNKTTKSAKAVYELQALTRFCLSGTPMMNNVTELFSLIHFLRIKPYCENEKFNNDFARPLKSSSQHSKDQAMKKLQALLKAILLRRTKKSKIDGNPILTLPERTTEIQHSIFSEDEQRFYQDLEQRTQTKVNRYLRANTFGKNYSNVLVLLLRLRQACCHPHLIKEHGIEIGGSSGMAVNDMIALAEGLSIDVVNRIKEAGAIECPICMDLAENATIFIPCGHSTCSECFARIQDPAQAMADDETGEGKHIKCPNCRGKVDPKQVTDFNSFKKVHMPEQLTAGDGDLDDDAVTESDDDSDSDDSDDGSDLGGFVVADDVVDDETASEGDDDTAEASKPVKVEKSKGTKDRKKKTEKGKGKAETKKPKMTMDQLKLESRKSASARRKYLRRLDRDWITSGKIDKVMEILQATHDRQEGEKTIIFSQFTALLDFLEIPINRKDWEYRRYDGSMTAIARNDAVVEFTQRPNCKIMLVSLKAGNSGLNLTAASQVIIFDPFWNPYIEEQAIDRAHRIGQRRPVKVHRILVPNTVEDRIITMQEQKRQLIEGALDENARGNIGRLGREELAFLFGVPAH